jgi:biotin transport system substrate-specific component
MSFKRNPKVRQHLPKAEEPAVKVSFPNELLWALVGLLLTIFSTFFAAFTTNAPWNWAAQGIQPQPLGVTFQVGAVLLTGCLGGKNAGALSQIAYVILGLFWLPVFAGGGGLGYFQEPTFGYILGFIPGGWLCGFLAFRSRKKLETLALSALAGLLAIHLCGLVYLVGLAYASPAGSQISWATLPQAIFNYSLAPLPGQLIIICAAAAVAFIIRQVLFY